MQHTNQTYPSLFLFMSCMLNTRMISINSKQLTLTLYRYIEYKRTNKRKVAN